jgi:hypothetical protein
MRLQGIGMVEGTEAGNLKVGDITRWNNGGLEKITSIELSKTGKTIICGIEYMGYFGEMVQSERKMRTTREVSIVASGNTILTGQYTFEQIEEAVEEVVEAVEEIEADHAEMKQCVHQISYRFTNYGDYVEVMLFVEDVANKMVLVAQKEAEFKNMKEADYLLKTLQKSGNLVELVEIVAYTG